MISLADTIAFYGAMLATILAFIQYSQWRRSKEILSISDGYYFEGPSGDLEIMITNTDPFPIYLSFVGVGYAFRSWVSPWKLSHQDLWSMKLTENGCASGKGVEQVLKSGEFIDVYFDKSDFRSVTKPTFRSGFAPRLSVWVDHSRSSKSLCKVIKW